MKNLLSALIVLFFISSTNLLGGFSENSTQTESWYLMMGAGASISEYHDFLETYNSSNKDKYASVNVDIIGLYFLVNHNLILGPILNTSGDLYEKSGNELSIFRFTFGASAKYFLNEINKGIFFRGDFGISKMVVSTKGKGEDKELRGANWGGGYGLLIGGGYAYPVNTGTSIVFTGSYAYRTGDTDDNPSFTLSSSSLNLTIGVLW